MLPHYAEQETLSQGGQTRSNFATQSWRATRAVQPLHVMVRHCVGSVAGLHAIVARQSCSVSVRLQTANVISFVFNLAGNMCDWYHDCVLCTVFDDGPLMKDDRCSTLCSHLNILDSEYTDLGDTDVFGK